MPSTWPNTVQIITRPAQSGSVFATIMHSGMRRAAHGLVTLRIWPGMDATGETVRSTGLMGRYDDASADPSRAIEPHPC